MVTQFHVAMLGIVIGGTGKDEEYPPDLFLAKTVGRTRMAQLPNSTPQFFTVAEVADITRVSRMTIYRMIHSGELPAVRVGSSYRVPRSALSQLLSGEAEDQQQQVSGA